MTDSSPAPLHTWLIEPMPADVLAAVERLRRAEDVQRIAIMPDVHLAKDVCVGTVLAMPAADGLAGVMPGSMGTLSYHVEGRGSAAALCSSAHGAGRALSRESARKRVSIRALCRQMEGVWFEYRRAAELREEAPAAYKDIQAVLRAQHDLVRIVRTLRPVLAYKNG